MPFPRGQGRSSQAASISIASSWQSKRSALPRCTWCCSTWRGAARLKQKRHGSRSPPSQRHSATTAVMCISTSAGRRPGAPWLSTQYSSATSSQVSRRGRSKGVRRACQPHSVSSSARSVGACTSAWLAAPSWPGSSCWPSMNDVSGLSSARSRFASRRRSWLADTCAAESREPDRPVSRNSAAASASAARPYSSTSAGCR